MDTTIQEIQPRRRLEFEQEENLFEACEDELVEPLHSNIPKEIIPRVGMEFQTEEEAYEFYNAYALAIGFSIRKSSVHKFKGTVLDRTFVCSCQGKRGLDKRDACYKSHRPETRFDCLAMLKINCRQTGKYRVVNFIAKHDHNLASPIKANLFRSHRKVSSSQASEVDMADISGIAPKNAYEFMARQAGGCENLRFAQVDYRNYLRTKRNSQIKVGDTGGVLEYLQTMKVEDPSFFYAIQVDEDDLITNIFWADTRMIADYEDFGDVVCFDTTYRKHKDGQPIALFVGLNHHRQTIAFGAALLYDETSASFVWLFDTFSKAMGGRLPKTMLTDQDAAMSAALLIQWPETCHRLCIWHIFQNATVHLSSVFTAYKDFARDFSNCIYDYEHEEDFLDAWNSMVDKYGLRDNEWLDKMFNIRQKWALVYGRDTFCADMTTTQRSESMNKLIKQYVSYKHDLRRFFENFQRLLYDRRYNEMLADFKAGQSKVVLFVSIEILECAASIYTPEVFKLFEREVGKAYDCHLEVSHEVGALVEYKVTPNKKHYSYIVSFDETGETVHCGCRKFEFAGLLCSHILKVFSSKGITKVPNKYILKRWTNNAKNGSDRVHGESLNSDLDPKARMGWCYRDLCRLSTRLVTRAAEFEDGYTLVKKGLTKLLSELDLSSKCRPMQPTMKDGHVEGGDPSHVHVNPNSIIKTIRGVKPKSRNRSSKRPQSALEKATNKNRRSKNNISAEPQVTQHIQIPLLLVDAVIGTNGSNISYIRRASGATVTIQEPRGVFGEMTIEINGTSSQVQVAQQLIQGSGNQVYNSLYPAAVPTYDPSPSTTGYASQEGDYGPVF